MVPLTGLEPVRSCPQRILSPRCLPFHHNGILIKHFNTGTQNRQVGNGTQAVPYILFQQFIQKGGTLLRKFLPGAVII